MIISTLANYVLVHGDRDLSFSNFSQLVCGMPTFHQFPHRNDSVYYLNVGQMERNDGSKVLCSVPDKCTYILTRPNRIHAKTDSASHGQRSIHNHWPSHERKCMHTRDCRKLHQSGCIIFIGLNSPWSWTLNGTTHSIWFCCLFKFNLSKMNEIYIDIYVYIVCINTECRINACSPYTLKEIQIESILLSHVGRFIIIIIIILSLWFHITRADRQLFYFRVKPLLNLLEINLEKIEFSMIPN